MRKLIIEPTINYGSWMVTEDKGKVNDILFDGTAQQCISFCEGQGAVKKGPRVFVVEDKSNG